MGSLCGYNSKFEYFRTTRTTQHCLWRNSDLSSHVVLSSIDLNRLTIKRSTQPYLDFFLFKLVNEWQPHNSPSTLVHPFIDP